MSSQELKNRIREAVESGPYRDDIHNVALFGSYAYGVPREDSDVDLLIEFVPTARIGMFRYAGMQRYFEERLGKKVDLATPDALSKYIREKILRQAEPVYEKV
jgi:predicted nucleotidyltransferase